MLLVVSCKKDDHCIIDEGSGFSVKYDASFCAFADEDESGLQKAVFYSRDETNANPCIPSLIYPLDNDNILIIALRVKVSDFYESLQTEIIRDECKNIIFYNFSLSNKSDTLNDLQNFYHSTVSVLDSVFTEQEVIFDVKYK